MKLVAIIPLPMSVTELVSKIDNLQNENSDTTLYMKQVLSGMAVFDKEFSNVMNCWCRECSYVTSDAFNNLGVNLNSVFVVCPDCGDKRCSKAQSHVNTCKDLSDV